jgi:phosphoglycerate dehydrogenase-like enzyme
MERLKALVPGHFLEELQPAAKALGVALVPYDRDGNPEADSSGAQVLYRWWISSQQGDVILQSHPELRWIHSGSAGVDHILTPAFLASKVVLTNSSGVHAESIAEWTVAGILALEKDLRTIFRQQEAREWEKVERPQLTGKRVVILGGGHLASEIAKRLRPFGVRLICVRRSGRAAPEFDETHSVDELLNVCRTADWLIVAAALTDSTRGLVDQKVLNALPPTSRLANVARGEIVDEHALVNALQQGRLAGAMLDVFSTEPLPADHSLWSMPQVIILPHTTWRSPQVREKQLTLFKENLRRFVKAEPLLNVVNNKAGY